MRMRGIVLFCIIAAVGLRVQGQNEDQVREKFKLKHLFNPYAHPWLSSTSVNAGFGLSAYSGELSNFDNFSFQRYHLNPNLNLGVQRRLTEYLSWRVEVSYVQLYSESSHSVLEDYQFIARNFDYYTALVIDTQPRPYLDSRFKKWNVYFFAGIGMTHFNPKEPEAKNKLGPADEKSAIILPLGAGIMYFKNDFLSFGFEISQRFTATDYLDGVVIANTKPDNDSYLVYGFKMNLNMFKRFKYGRYLKRKGYKK